MIYYEHKVLTAFFPLYLLLTRFSNRKRMTAHECLIHPWLRGDYAPRLEPIDMMRYIPIRDKIRAKYKEWEKFLVPIGRLAEYSSLRKLQLEKYRIHDTQFGELTCHAHHQSMLLYHLVLYFFLCPIFFVVSLFVLTITNHSGPFM